MAKSRDLCHRSRDGAIMLTHFVPKVYFKCADKGNGIFQLRRYSQTLRLLQSSFKIEKFFWLHRCWSQIIKMFNIWCWRQVWDVGDTFLCHQFIFATRISKWLPTLSHQHHDHHVLLILWHFLKISSWNGHINFHCKKHGS